VRAAPSPPRPPISVYRRQSNCGKESSADGSSYGNEQAIQIQASVWLLRELSAGALHGCAPCAAWYPGRVSPWAGSLGGVLMSVACESVSAGRVFFILQAAKRFLRVPLAFTVVVVIAGCAPTRTGATLDALSAPKPGVARVFVLRDKSFGQIIDAGFQAYLDEAPMGDLKTGTFVYRDVPPGQHKLFFARPLEMFRGSQQAFSAAPSRTCYFRLELNDKGKWITASSIVAGGAGALVSSAISAAADERGLFDFTPLDDATARAAMAELRLAE
jgi:hypothetical protein